MNIIVLGAVAAALAAGGGPPVDTYGSGSARPGDSAELTLTYLAEAGFAGAVKLTCDPAGGGHPDPAAACATLAEVDADPDRLTPSTGACILIYQPVTATITGTWRGKPVNWTHRYGNACEMGRATRGLFTF